jgi:hypothetical protein
MRTIERAINSFEPKICICPDVLLCTRPAYANIGKDIDLDTYR